MPCLRCKANHRTKASWRACIRRFAQHTLVTQSSQTQFQWCWNEVQTYERLIQDLKRTVARLTAELIESQRKYRQLSQQPAIVEYFDNNLIQRNIDVDSILLNIHPSSLVHLLSPFVALGSTKYRQPGDLLSRHQAIIISSPTVFIQKQEIPGLRRILESRAFVFQYDQDLSKLASKSVIIDRDFLINCLLENNTRCVRIVQHGMKSCSLWPAIKKIRIIQNPQNRIDFGFCQQTRAITTFQSQVIKKHTMFNENSGTLSGRYNGNRFKVYSTLIHHLKRRIRKITLPRYIKKNISIRRSIFNMKNFIEKKVILPQTLGIRYQITMMNFSLQFGDQLNDMADELHDLKQHITGYSRRIDLTSQAYFLKLQDTLNNFLQIGRDDSLASARKKAKYGNLLNMLGMSETDIVRQNNRYHEMLNIQQDEQEIEVPRGPNLVEQQLQMQRGVRQFAVQHLTRRRDRAGRFQRGQPND